MYALLPMPYTPQTDARWTVDDATCTVRRADAVIVPTAPRHGDRAACLDRARELALALNRIYDHALPRLQ